MTTSNSSSVAATGSGSSSAAATSSVCTEDEVVYPEACETKPEKDCSCCCKTYRIVLNFN